MQKQELFFIVFLFIFNISLTHEFLYNWVLYQIIRWVIWLNDLHLVSSICEFCHELTFSVRVVFEEITQNI